VPQLSEACTQFSVFRLSEPESERFDQVALLAVRSRVSGAAYEANRQRLIEAIWKHPLPILSGREKPYDVGQSADAVWNELRRERASYAAAAAAAPELPKIEDREEEPMFTDMFSELPGAHSAPATGPVLVPSKPKSKKKVETIWPSGYVVGDQLQLFG
jgi:hypothetical protein